MTVLSPHQVAYYARQAGFNGIHLVEATAIGLAESGGDTGVTSPNPDGGTNVGVMQLDTKGKGAGYTVAQLSDPLTNMRIAFRGSDGGRDWSAWATWPAAAHRHWQAALRAVGEMGGHGAPPPGAGGPGLPNPFAIPGQIVGVFSKAGQAVDWLLQPSHWIRIFAFLAGVGNVALGVWLLSHAGGEI